MDIIQCQSSTFLFKDDSNELFVGVYVDDILVVGLEDKVDSFVNVLKRRFTLTVKKEVNNFVECEFEWVNNNVVLNQKVMVEGLEVKFRDNIDKKYDKSPTSPYMIVENVGE